MWLPSMFFSRKSTRSRRRPLGATHRRQRGYRPLLDGLETRIVPANLTPNQVATAYGVNLINFGTASNPIPGNGAGQTIAIIDPGDDSALVSTGPNFDSSDLHNFDLLANLPDPPSFTVVGENGGHAPLTPRFSRLRKTVTSSRSRP